MNATLGTRFRALMAVGAFVGLATAVACSKSPASDAASSPSASASVVAPSAQAAASASAPASTGGASVAWSGAYTAKVGAVEPPENAKEKTWTKDPGNSAVGKGAIDLSITAPRGDVTGEAKGPLGDMIVAGTFDGHDLSANLAPKDPKADGAMTGFLLLTGESSGPLKGNMRVSSKDARIVREASVEIAKK